MNTSPISKIEGQRESSNMQTLKATIFLGALLSTGMAFAQAADPAQAPAAPAPQASESAGQMHHANPAKQAKRLGKKLGLNRDQVAQIQPILADRMQQMQALRADASLAPQDRRAKAQAIQQDSKTKIEALLNDTQKQQFEQLMAERRAHHNHGKTQGQQG